MEDIIQNMKDAGCDREIITKICRLYADGQIQEVVKVLRRHRCNLMEQLHESQSKVDCLDFFGQETSNLRKMQKKHFSFTDES